MSLQVDYPEIVDGVVPRHRFMSAYEQRVEPPDRQWQYLLFAAEPYETIAFKVSEACCKWLVSRYVDKATIMVTLMLWRKLHPKPFTWTASLQNAVDLHS